jgi:large subunit ribosomal protein L18
MKNLSRKINRQHRHNRIRAKVTGTEKRPRLVIFRSAKHFSAQIINDETKKTLVGVIDKHLSKDIKASKDLQAKVAAAEALGRLIAEKAKAKKIEAVVFDAAGYKYHGRVKAFADGARAGGLKF